MARGKPSRVRKGSGRADRGSFATREEVVRLGGLFAVKKEEPRGALPTA